ncbi:MAG: hypothetical protein ACYTBJ_13940 [Planctomycetota bacterium]|jgi:hypothetical protein
MAETSRRGRLFGLIVFFSVLAFFGYFSRGIYRGAMTIHQLLTENKHLKEAIGNLTQEDQIGYAKVLSQEVRDGRLFTTIRFVETARDDKWKKILEKEYTIEGDIVHFDALIVKFGDQMVMEGDAKAMYLWRRVYGEKMTPEEGYAIEEPGAEPARYKDLLAKLALAEREMFWSGIWELANNPDALKEYGIDAIYGNGVYSRLQEGLIYIFRITPTGQFYPEVVLDM